jgi:hypothetical protein
MNNWYDVVIVGGGAAGFFTAINLAEMKPDAKIIILEQSKESLSKVRISGGGRCNVSHACFDVKELINNYPRGNKELLGPFNRFNCSSTMDWFEQRGVALKIEDDGRVFPISDDSMSIVNCLHNLTRKHRIFIRYSSKVKNIKKMEDSSWIITFDEQKVTCKYTVITTGSSPFVWDLLKNLNHTIIHPVPSLFTFHINDQRINGLMGLSVNNVTLQINDSTIITNGPLLITHWGMSGPAILKASAWGARLLAEKKYNFEIIIDWLPHISVDDIFQLKISMATKSVLSNPLYSIPNRLWKSLLASNTIGEKIKWADLSKIQLHDLIQALKNCHFQVMGKSTFKDEFVTSGGVDLKEIDFKHFVSRKHGSMYLAGEVLNIDAVTGGFNFQAAWTGAYIAASSLAERL